VWSPGWQGVAGVTTRPFWCGAAGTTAGVPVTSLMRKANHTKQQSTVSNLRLWLRRSSRGSRKTLRDFGPRTNCHGNPVRHVGKYTPSFRAKPIQTDLDTCYVTTGTTCTKTVPDECLKKGYQSLLVDILRVRDRRYTRVVEQPRGTMSSLSLAYANWEDPMSREWMTPRQSAAPRIAKPRRKCAQNLPGRKKCHTGPSDECDQRHQRKLTPISHNKAPMEGPREPETPA